MDTATRSHSIDKYLIPAIVLALAVLGVTAQTARAAGTTFTVNTTDDANDGACDATHCSLREAINAANAMAGIDTIAFNIPGPGPHTIRPSSSLPKITSPAVIDGTTEPDFAGTPMIELDGSNTALGSYGLHISAGGSTIRGLVINRFGGANGRGIFLETNGGNVIEGNYIGTDLTGTLSQLNGQGIWVSSANNIIGGTTTQARNIISGNGIGIYLAGSATRLNLVEGNYIGTDVSGSNALPNTTGISIVSSGSNVIGGTTPEARNIISGNSQVGVNIFMYATGNNVKGNYIGTDSTGTMAVGNGQHGVKIIASNNIIGGTVVGAGNLISGNTQDGIYIGNWDIASTGNQIQGNIIGADVSGNNPLGNGRHGVSFNHANATNNVIGGSAAAENVIAFNGGDGITVIQGTSNRISNNAIFSNTGLGINLGTSGVTPNDIGDSDSGANNLQNFPILTSVQSDSVGTLIEGTLNSNPNVAFTLEFFANSVCDPSGYGEGENHLGSAQVITDASGNISFSVIKPPVAAGQLLTATATASNNTSEFSPCIQVTDFAASPGAANALAPNGTVEAVNTAFSWSKVDSATRYLLEVNGTSGNVISEWFDAMSICTSGHCSTRASVLLPDNQSYTWRVQTWNGVGTGPWSNQLSFSVGQLPDVPVTVSPSGTITTFTPRLTWNESDRAAQYRVQIDGPSGYSYTTVRNTIDICDSGTCQLVSPQLPAGGNYSWKLQSINAYGSSAWSNSSDFTVDFFVSPETPILVAPSGTITDLGFNFRWNNTAGVGYYYLEVYHAGYMQPFYIGTYAEGSVCTSDACSVPASPNFTNDDYTWRVRASNPYGQTQSPDMAFTLSVPPPEPPMLIAPEGTITTNSPMYTWNEVSGADRYHLSIDSVSGNVYQTYILPVSCTSGVCSTTGPALINGDYTWKVRAYDYVSGYGGWSVPVAFTVGALPDAATLIRPQGIIGLHPHFAWNKVFNATRYFLSVDGNAGSVIGDWYDADVICSGGICRVDVSTTLANGEYVWKVQTENSAGFGPWSSEKTFSIGYFVVNTVDDLNDGICDASHCSMREAITIANIFYGTNTIEFNIPGSGPFTIRPTSNLPIIISPVTIDGTSQPGFSGTPIVELSGANVSGNASGLTIVGGNSTIRGLVINRFSGAFPYGAGILIQTNGGNTIEGNFIGTDTTGTVDLGNQRGVMVYDTANNIIGGNTPADRNVISGNRTDIYVYWVNASGNIITGNFIGTDLTGTALLTGASNNGEGVFIGSSAHDNIVGGTGVGTGNVISGHGTGILVTYGAHDNVIQGNFIGADVSGMVALGLQNYGISLAGASYNLIGGTASEARNVISGNNYGIYIFGDGSGQPATTGNIVQGNYIGTTADGMSKLPNYSGIYLADGSALYPTTNNVVGGTDSGAGNLISGNTKFGILIFGRGAYQNVVAGNLIGTDMTGAAALGNGEGIHLESASQNIIGGTAPGARNVISGNGDYGVYLVGYASICPGPSSTTTQNIIQGNFIGTDITGISPLGNSKDGIAIKGGSRNRIGGPEPNEGNVIAYNGNSGVMVIRPSGSCDEAVGNVFSSNSIYANGSIGIDLMHGTYGSPYEYGVTPNDPSDGDIGANNLQNYPALTWTTSDGSMLGIRGTLNSTANTTFRIEFFANDTCDPSGYGEGEIYLGSLDVTTGGDGNTSFSTTLAIGVPVGAFITTTATDPVGNTSEFSQCQVVIPPPVAPTSLTAAAASPTQINLAWTDNSTDETEFHIERSLDGSTGWTEVASGGTDTISYSDMGLTCSTTYYYRVRGFRAGDGWYSDYSNVASVMTGPCAPSNLSAAGAEPGQIVLGWTDNSPDETAFYVERSADGSTGWMEIGTAAANVTGYTDSGLTCNTAYYYRVRAFRASDGLYSDYSNVASTVTGPCAPSGLNASAASRTQINLGWTDNSDETEFIIERSPDGITGWRSIGTVGADMISYVDTTLMCETAYYYRVRAFRSGDGLYSDYSNVASATTPDCEVATNGSFELDSDGDRIPDAWSGGGLTGRDGQDCTIARIGQCSFLMTSGGKDKSLSQVVNQGGGAGEVFTLSLWVKADDISIDGLLQARVTIYYADGTNEVQTLNLATGTYDWQHFALTFTTAHPYMRLEITLLMNVNRGSVWFDKVSLAQEGQFPPVAPPIPIEP